MGFTNFRGRKLSQASPEATRPNLDSLFIFALTQQPHQSTQSKHLAPSIRKEPPAKNAKTLLQLAHGCTYPLKDNVLSLKRRKKEIEKMASPLFAISLKSIN
jgi:hypothetical protein